MSALGRMKPWLAAVVAAIVWDFVALFVFWTWWMMGVSRLVVVDDPGLNAAGARRWHFVAGLPTTRSTVTMMIVGCVAAVLFAWAVHRLFGRRTGPALLVVTLGPLLAVCQTVGVSAYNAWLDPPAVRAGALLGMYPLQLLGLGLLVALPMVLAIVVTLLLGMFGPAEAPSVPEQHEA